MDLLTELEHYNLEPIRLSVSRVFQLDHPEAAIVHRLTFVSEPRKLTDVQPQPSSAHVRGVCPVILRFIYLQISMVSNVAISS